jgi:predicted amino acid racemase
MYPRIIIDKQGVLDNAIILRDLAATHGVSITPVVKALAGHELIRDIAALGFERIGDASLPHIRAYADIPAEKWLLRNPMQGEIPELVRLTEGALITEAAAIRQIAAEADRQGKIYKVILMAELGDLREGCETDELLTLATLTDIFPHLELVGLGTNLSCFGNILPDQDNMIRLVELAAQVEQHINKPLPLLSGGNSSSYLMLRNGELPPAINDLRLGESILLGRLPCYDRPIEGLSQQTFMVEAEIVELKYKPSLPWVISGAKDSFGGYTAFSDKGKRWRALAALGKQEIYINGLVALDSGVELLGGCSDCIVCDITESAETYQVGDILSFACDYAALATGMSSNYFEKTYK